MKLRIAIATGLIIACTGIARAQTINVYPSWDQEHGIVHPYGDGGPAYYAGPQQRTFQQPSVQSPPSYSFTGPAGESEGSARPSFNGSYNLYGPAGQYEGSIQRR